MKFGKSFIKRAENYFRYKFLSPSFVLSREYLLWIKWRNACSAETFSTSSSDQGVESDQKIIILVPGTTISGGIAVILQHANRLAETGCIVEIFSQSNFVDTTWFPNQKVKVYPYKECYKRLKNEPFDILMATSWSTAYPVAMSKAKRKIYFVQSDESRFFPKDKRRTELIRSTYSLPLEFITEARWIQRWLKDEFGKDSFYVPNGIDLSVFKKTDPIEPRGKRIRILLEGAINIPYKGMDDAYEALSGLDVDIWIVSNNGKPRKEWEFSQYFEGVPYGEMNRIYSSCDIFLKMSRVEGFFGPPMEAMACGCAVVVGKVTGYDEYIVDGYNALVVEEGDIDGAKKAVELLMNDVQLREELIVNGYQTVKKWGWEKASNYMQKALFCSKCC